MSTRQKSVKLYFQQRKSQTRSTTDHPKIKTRNGSSLGDDVKSVEWPADLDFLQAYCSDVAVALAIQRHVFSVAKEAEFHDRVISILGSLVMSETRRLAQKEVDFSAWLGNERFLRALAAAVLVSEGLCSENEALIRSGAVPFEIVLVIEVVLKHSVNDSKPGRRRLQQWEEDLLLSTVWTDDWLYDMMAADRKAAKRHLLDSPTKALRSMTAEQEASDRVTRLELFFRKFFRLAVRKIDRVCSRLDLPDSFQQSIWQAFLGVIEKGELEHRLLQHRSLLHLIAALTYSLCRLNDHEMTFKQIIGALVDEHHPASLYRSIWMGEGEEPADLVTFYNKEFLPRVQEVLHSLPSVEEADAPATVPATPETPKGNSKKRHLGAWPLPSVHSPLMATNHLSKRVQLDMSPMKHHLSRTVTHPSSHTSSSKAVVTRRLHF